MFWKNKNKVCYEKKISNTVDKKPVENWEYVELYPLTQRLVHLNYLACRIDELFVFDVNNTAMLDFQTGLRAAYIAEFERDYKDTFCKSIDYNDFKKTRSTL